jgi:hypothetical protein
VKKRKLALIAALLLSVVFLTFTMTVDFYLSQDVSLIRLIAIPWLYHNRKVSVRGFLVLNFEHSVLYLSEEDYLHNLANGVWIADNTGILSKSRKQFDKHYMLIEGKYDASYKPRSNVQNGAITDVQKVENLQVRDYD